MRFMYTINRRGSKQYYTRKPPWTFYLEITLNTFSLLEILVSFVGSGPEIYPRLGAHTPRNRSNSRSFRSCTERVSAAVSRLSFLQHNYWKFKLFVKTIKRADYSLVKSLKYILIIPETDVPNQNQNITLNRNFDISQRAPVYYSASIKYDTSRTWT